MDFKSGDVIYIETNYNVGGNRIYARTVTKVLKRDIVAEDSKGNEWRYDRDSGRRRGISQYAYDQILSDQDVAKTRYEAQVHAERALFLARKIEKETQRYARGETSSNRDLYKLVDDLVAHVQAG